ncbi:hypothetical protein [Lacrimispora sp.]|uniref:hypothetical protein n=1 Tax=Lacrimispora sp. TaxID=2719234 RepID=UPI0028AC9DDB|nr:hypothetical protein [Lacrimispora sp.]
MFGNRMVKSAIPERVFALCKEVISKPMLEAELKALLEPEQLRGKTSYFGTVRTAAEQLKLISIKENEISLAVDKENIKTMEAMRCYINMNFESLNGSLFYDVTQCYADMGTSVLQHSSVSQMTDVIGKNIGNKVIEDDMLAWRFWMPFLGFGYMHDMQMLPNLSVFLGDIIASLKLKKKTEYTIDEFVSVIQPYANIVLRNSMENKTFNYAFSNAIRTLHDLKVINAEHRLDSREIWSLHPFDGHELDGTITHITIGG